MKKTHILVALTAVGIIFGIFYRYVVYTGNTDSLKEIADISDIAAIRRSVVSRVRRTGGKKAYEAIKQAASLQELPAQHRLTHIFGEALYQLEGLDGVGVCDDSFGFGCFHGFFAKAVQRNGLSVVSELDRRCQEKFGPLGLGCPHGIGHGLGEFFGPARLSEQLAACDSLSWKGALFGCQQGVFMEYHFPALIDERQISIGPRVFDPSEPYDPCGTVSDRFGRACYFELPSWWLAVGKTYTEISDFCSDIDETENKEECFRGMGYAVVPTVAFAIDKTKAACEAISLPAHRILCLAGASWSFFANPQTRNDSGALCEGITAPEKVICQKKADLLNQ